MFTNRQPAKIPWVSFIVVSRRCDSFPKMHNSKRTKGKPLLFWSFPVPGSPRRKRTRQLEKNPNRNRNQEPVVHCSNAA